MTDFAATGPEEPSSSLELIVLEARPRTVLCRPADGEGRLHVRTPGRLGAVAGQTLRLRVERRSRHGGADYLDGAIESVRTDVAAWGLAPLGVERFGDWDPSSEYWRDEDEPPEPWMDGIVALGARPMLELQPVADEGADASDDDPILDAVERAERGGVAAAREALVALIERDPRHVDAHAHLGHLAFDRQPARALAHYEVGLAAVDRALSAFEWPALPRGLVCNRPYLRCLHGATLSLWRLERFDAALAMAVRLLRSDPSDGAGARFLLDALRRHEIWRR